MQPDEMIQTEKQIVPEPPSTCPSKKKCFPTKEAAEQFSNYLAESYPDQIRQYVYACEDCPAWHLTAMPPEAHAMVRSRSYFQSIPESQTNGSSRRLGARKYDHRKHEISELFKQGLKFGEISRQTGIPYQAVYCTCIDLGLYQPKFNRPTSNGKSYSLPGIKPDLSVEALSSEEEALRARLLDIQAKKQRLIEAKQLKIVAHNVSGVLLQKEGNALMLSFTEARDLVERLAAHLAASQTIGEVAA